MKSKLNCILLIDDDNLTNAINRIVIEKAGCADYIIKKESAGLGLKYLSESASDKEMPFPDLIILDMEMPVLDGWGFLNQFKYLKKIFPFSPDVVMLTSFLGRDIALKAFMSTEISGFYHKPLTPDILASIMN